MSAPRPGSAGATRACPHCKATILESASICPACKHYLRFDNARTAEAAAQVMKALQVEGTIHHPSEGGAWEYSVVLTIRDDDGTEIARQVVGVGALHADEKRTFNLSVEVMPTNDMRKPRKRTRH